MKKVIRTDKAPKPVGPYSQALEVGQFVFLSGQVPIDPEKGAVVAESVKDQTVQVMENIREVLGEAGLSLEDIVKSTIFLKSMGDFEAVNEVYAEYLKEPYPARSCVEVAKLPLDVKVEIEVLALKS
jgi:2-iminobutanoate/2-iminopropanoate deaminase